MRSMREFHDTVHFLKPNPGAHTRARPNTTTPLPHVAHHTFLRTSHKNQRPGLAGAARPFQVSGGCDVFEGVRYYAGVGQ
jgi:hypothetical protein